MILVESYPTLLKLAVPPKGSYGLTKPPNFKAPRVWGERDPSAPTGQP